MRVSRQERDSMNEKKKETYEIHVPVTAQQRARKEDLRTSWPAVIEAGLRALEAVGR